MEPFYLSFTLGKHFLKYKEDEVDQNYNIHILQMLYVLVIDSNN